MPTANFPKAEAQENPVVQVNISAAGRKLSQTEKSAGPANAQLKQWDAQEADRQRKLEYMHSIEERLQNENLSEEDRKTLEADATWLKIETTASRHNSEDVDFSGHFNHEGSLKQIEAREEWQEMHDKEVRELTSLAHQENADLAATEMKAAEAEATPKEAEKQSDDFTSAFADKESLQHLSDLLEAQNAAHTDDNAETKEENATVPNASSAFSGENVEEAQKR